ncbi:hypothetical protein GT352_28255 [Streptomyces sp. SID1046]|uniref:hypothetical protein n=1 Tax=Streptomyces sp. SID1046 TaxID=2690249 RepID=UPI001370A508|nr:hypothetical protein [Streptomyces sp. SID1046]MYV77794.1 hypothetical protein [Streptomyces sp. SID1046]
MAAVGSVDVELLVIQWLQARLGNGVVVRDELDNNLMNELPTVQVERIAAGDDDGFRVDRAFVDVDVYAATRGAAIALALQVRGLLLTELPGSTTGGAVVGRVQTIAAPGPRPYENTGLRRIGATYEIYSHPVS